MMRVDSQYDLRELLERAGARLVGPNRADCPRCSGKRTVSYHGELFCCHYAGCRFKGNSFALARKLGLARRLSPYEVRDCRHVRDIAKKAAHYAYAKIKSRRWELYEMHRSLAHILSGTQRRLRQEPESELAWSALAFVHDELPKVRAELLLLETAPIRERLAFLEASQSERRRAVDRAVFQGGILDSKGRILELGDGP